MKLNFWSFLALVVIACSITAIITMGIMRYDTPQQLRYEYDTDAQEETADEGPKYIIKEYEPLEEEEQQQEDAAPTGGNAADAGELERLIEDIDKQAETQDIENP